MDYSKKTAPVRTADGGVVIGLSYASVKKLSLYHICRRPGFFQRIAVNVCGDADGGVTKGLGYGLEGDIHINQCSCVGVPLRYNYDKPEKPRISRVFGYQARFFILFQPEKSSREVVIS